MMFEYCLETIKDKEKLKTTLMITNKTFLFKYLYVKFIFISFRLDV